MITDHLKSRAPSLIVDHVGDFSILLHPEKPRWLLTTEVGARMALLFQDGKSDDEICASIRQEFDLEDSDDVQGDLEFLKSELANSGLIDNNSPEPASVSAKASKPSVNSITIYVTEQCNLRCKHCAIVEGKMPEDQLTAENIFELIHGFAKINPAGSISFLGGEPFLHPEMAAFLEAACSVFSRVTVSTNGTFVTEKLAARLAPLKSLNMQVSLDGADPAVHDFIRGKGSFQKTWNAIDCFIAAGMGDRLTVAVTLTKSALGQVRELVALCDEKGIGTLRFLNLNKMKAARTHWDAIAPDPSEWRATIRYLLFEVAKRNDGKPVKTRVTGSFPGFVPDPGEKKDHWCPIGETLIIDSQKQVFNCPSLEIPLTNPGNLDSNSLEEITSGEANAATRQWMLQRKHQVAECSVCAWKNFCGGGCTAFMAHRSGSILSNDELCDFRRDLYREYVLRKMGLYAPAILASHGVKIAD